MAKWKFIAALGLAISTPAGAQAVGDWVLSPWRDSTMLFPGVVVARGDGAVTVRFDDGTTETRMEGDVRPFNWRAGSRIACQWSDGKWYNAVIVSISENGYDMTIRYDSDGTLEDTNTGRCRTR